MTSRTLLRRSLRFHARSHLGVVLGATIGSAALIGALLVGDSLRESLRSMALTRLGNIHYTLTATEVPFQADLKERLCSTSPSSGGPGYLHPSSACPFSAVLSLPGVVAKGDGSARANRVNILGVDAAGWPQAAGWSNDIGTLGETALINETLAQRLQAKEGDEIVIRVRKPSALALDAAISPRDEAAVALRMKIGAILPAKMLGNFSLSAQQEPPANIFLPRQLLEKKVGLTNRANLLVFGPV